LKKAANASEFENAINMFLTRNIVKAKQKKQRENPARMG
jgi:hypothetical protein